MRLPLKNGHGNLLPCRTSVLRRFVLCFLLFSSFLFQLNAQSQPAQLKITGQVSTDDGKPMQGVTVQLKESFVSTITTADGNFSIIIPVKNSGILVFSNVGFAEKEVSINNATTALSIRLAPVDKSLDEVIVVGYGKQKKATLTGSVTQINTDEIKQSSSVNISNSLAGRMPGVIANNRSGEPGADGSSILIRGAGTTGNASPLFVIDGVANRSGFERLNPNDIESISILKDASAAIYGAQAANGVILVTTKRGKSGKPTISYDVNFGLSQPTRVPQLVSSYEYALFRNEKDARQNAGTPTFSAAQIQKYKDGSDPINYPNTDWYDEVLKPLTPQTQHSLSVAGGSDRVRYFMSGGYTYQDAFYRKSATNYKQYNLRINLDAQVTKLFKLSLDVVGRSENRDYAPTGADGIFLSILGSYPGLAPFYPNGLPVAGIEGPNPLQAAQGYDGYRRAVNNS
ncbi:MAG: SusC/RagA family TonB-linked outer membrane protein, partial [Chitinophagaceae bacterium]